MRRVLPGLGDLCAAGLYRDPGSLPSCDYSGVWSVVEITVRRYTKRYGTNADGAIY